MTFREFVQTKDQKTDQEVMNNPQIVQVTDPKKRMMLPKILQTKRANPNVSMSAILKGQEISNSLNS